MRTSDPDQPREQDGSSDQPSGTTILAHLPVGVWVARAPTGEVLYTNQAFTTILGMEAVPGVDIEGAPATYQIHDRAGNPYPVEGLPFSRVLAVGSAVVVDDLVIHRTDGHRAYVRAVASPVRDDSGAIAFVIVAFTEITAEVRAIAERARVEERLRFAMDHAPVALFAIDRNGVITLSEGAALRALGFRSGELVGRSAFELYADHPQILADLHQTLAGETVTATVVVGEVTLESWLTPVRGEGGEVTGLIGISTDVSERCRLQARSIQNDRVSAMGVLAASVAHEINNPLTFVLGSLEQGHGELDRAARALDVAAGGGPDGMRAAREALARVRVALTQARSAAERVGGIARDLRTFARPADSDEVGAVALGAVIRAVLQLVRKEIEARAQLTVALGDTPPVSGNEPRLVQVVLNLLVNAWQALPETDPASNEIAIRTWQDDRFVVIEASDTGPGVALEDRPRIFDPFFTTKDVGEGSGLGLFVCRNIVTGFGGEISVGDRPGGGAAFRVRLPVADRPVPAAAEARAAAAVLAASSRRRRVLIVDDDERIASVFVHSLADLDLEVSTVPDGRQAVELLVGGERFDLVYCDLMMRGMTGMDIHEAVARRAPDRLRNMVFMTGGAYTPRAQRFVEEQAAAVVYKPFDIRAETRRRLGLP